MKATLRRQSREGLLPRDEAVDLVKANQDIADLSQFKEAVFKKLERLLFGLNGKIDKEDLGKYVTKSRVRNLAQLKKFVDKIFSDKNSRFDVVKQLNYQLAYAKKKKLKLSELREETGGPVDQLFNDPESPLDFQLEAILSDPQLSRLWLDQVDKLVGDSSRRNLTAIDRSKKEKIRKEIVIVGGGPLTSLIVQLLGPYYNITVVTDQDSVGKPWRNRPLYINSTVNESAAGARLPLLNSGTTPISVSGQIGAVRLSNLINAGSLRVLCDDGVTREYISGQKLGAAVATNIVLGATDYIVGQTVDFTQTKYNPDGTKELTLVDKKGKKRKIDANAVIALTGPGREVCKIDDAKTRRSYELAAKSVNSQIEKNRKFARSGRLNKIVWNLPRILTLTSIEKLYGFWYDELGANPDPKYFPLKAIFELNKESGLPKEVAIIGGADTAYTLSELINLDGPPASYPFDLEAVGKPRITHYNIPEQTPEEFAQAVRPRYKRVFSANNQDVITTIADRVARWSEVRKDRRTVKIEVTAVSGNTRKSKDKTTKLYDYVIPATGFEKTEFEKLIGGASGLRLDIVSDLANEPVVKGDKRRDFYVVGSASGLKLQDYPAKVQVIIKQLRIPENTISLWVNGLLAERFAWSFLLQNPVNVDRVESINSQK